MLRLGKEEVQVNALHSTSYAAANCVTLQQFGVQNVAGSTSKLPAQQKISKHHFDIIRWFFLLSCSS
jgi:hypothetical protein